MVRLSKANLVIAALVPIICGAIVMYYFFDALNVLYPYKAYTASLINSQLSVIGAFLYIGFIIYWSVMIYLIYLLQESLVLLDANLDRAADIGARHLQESKTLLKQVIDILKKFEK